MAYVPKFADLINRALARLDRSPSWLAQRIDVNPSTISRWLNQGARPGDPEIVVRVADVLGLTGQVQELLAAAGYGYVEMAEQESANAASVTATTPPVVLRSSSPASLTNLPAAVTPFLGRERELAELTRLLADPKLRLFSVIGPGGMGKTRLAVECARREMTKYPDGVCFVALAPLQAVDDLLPAIASAAGFSFLTDARTPQQQLFDYLREKALLLVLDNFEHLIDGTRLITDILQAAPRVKIVTTSRERLRLSGETVYQLDGMDFPDGETLPDAEGYSAVQLFAQSARFAQPDFSLQSEELAYVVRICRVVDGTPLGILLAASWVEMLPLPEITDEIERSLDFLSNDLRDLPERQRSLRAVFDHSWRLLTDNERSVFGQMAVFRGGFTRQAAEEVVGAGLPLLTALLNKSLIQRTEAGRYELHELVRQYATEKLTLDPASPTLHQRHARYYLALLHRQMDDLSGRQLQGRQDNVFADLDNIRTGWDWAAGSREAMLIGSALEDLCRFYEWQGRYAEGVAAGQTAVRMARSVGEGRVEVNALIWQAAFSRILGDQAEAQHLLQESASLLSQFIQMGVDVRREQAALVLGLARLARDAGDGSAARQRYTKAVSLYEALADHLSVARTLSELSYVLRNLENVGEMGQNGNHNNEAAQAARRAISISRQHNYPLGIAEGLIQLSASVHPFSDEAQQSLEESLALYKQLNIESGIIAAQCQLGFVKMVRREDSEAWLINQQVLRAAEHSGNLALAARAYTHLGMIQLANKIYDSASQMFRRSTEACRTAGVIPALAISTCYLGYAERGLDNSAGATKYLAEALRLGLEVRSQWPLVTGINLWAILLADGGELERALEFYFCVISFKFGQEIFDNVISNYQTAVADIPSDVIAAIQRRGEARMLLSTAQEILDEIEQHAEG